MSSFHFKHFSIWRRVKDMQDAFVCVRWTQRTVR